MTEFVTSLNDLSQAPDITTLQCGASMTEFVDTLSSSRRASMTEFVDTLSSQSKVPDDPTFPRALLHPEDPSRVPRVVVSLTSPP
jgi:hypothetical protein